VTVDQMRAVDREAIAHGITLERMMENAGAGLAWLAAELLGGSARGRRVVVLAGPGGNGGGGLVAARRLLGWGADVDVLLAAEPARFAPLPLAQLEILGAMGAAIEVGADSFDGAELVLDAILGYSQRGAPRGGAAELIVASAAERVLSLDVPSGLELETGRLHEPAVEAEATLTLALPKRGLRAARDAVGSLYLADISIAATVYSRLGIAYDSPFAYGPIVALDC
jgi:NAD(P)H-hydrate epimerase